MNKEQAEAALQFFFPGKNRDDAFLEMVRLFLAPLNKFISDTVKAKRYTVGTVVVRNKSRNVSPENYPRNNVREVALRAILITQKYPNWTLDYAGGRRNLDKPETGEPITIAVVLTIIAALAPIVLPFILDLIQSFLAEGTKQKEIDQKAAQDAAKTKAETQEKQLKYGLIAAGVVLVGVGLYLASRRA